MARKLNFTKAAEALGYSQSAVTTQIKQLEAEIGAPLFQRSGNKVALTSIGSQLLAYANEIVNLSDNIKNLLNPDPDNMSGSLRIGFVDSLGIILSPCLEAYCKKHPKVQVEAFSNYNSELFTRLYNNEADIIFTIGANGTPPSHCLELLCMEIALISFASANHPIAAAKDPSFHDLCQYPLIMSGKSSFLERKFFELARSQHIAPNTFLHTNSNSLTFAMVEKGLGIGFVDRNFFDFMEKSSIVPLAISDFSLNYNCHVFRNHNTWLSPQLSSFIDCLDMLR